MPASPMGHDGSFEVRPGREGLVGRRKPRERRSPGGNQDHERK